ncbi:MAG: LysR family transcriptional regulator [Lachnospiraceae bacterium]|nr:LysR family transcriptional regulator [Lachnospiraceae bacterium]
MNVNLEYYKIFYYVGKLGGITLAAEELSITQPAVSQAVRSLERALGTELFVRTGKGVHLTPAGEVLYAYVRRGYEEIQTGERKIREMINMEIGEIRIGASDMTLRFYLLPFLQKFHETYPGIRLTVTNGPTPETLRYLAEGKIDFGLVTAPFTAKKGYGAVQVRRIQDIFVAGERFAKLKGRVHAWSLLKELPLVYLEKHTSTRTYIDEFLRAQGVAVQPEIELATSDMLVQFALKNLGVACVVKDFAQEYLDKGELFAVEFETDIPERPMYLVTNEKLPATAASARFLKLLKENMNGEAGGSMNGQK